MSLLKVKGEIQELISQSHTILEENNKIETLVCLMIVPTRIVTTSYKFFCIFSSNKN